MAIPWAEGIIHPPKKPLPVEAGEKAAVVRWKIASLKGLDQCGNVCVSAAHRRRLRQAPKIGNAGVLIDCFRFTAMSLIFEAPCWLA